jgi:hypothetical protein
MEQVALLVVRAWDFPLGFQRSGLVAILTAAVLPAAGLCRHPFLRCSKQKHFDLVVSERLQLAVISAP